MYKRQAQYLGQCTWYSLGRFYEVYGVKLTGWMPNAQYWLDEVVKNNASKGVISKSGGKNPVPNSIFVKKTSSGYGHVGFVEGVSADGKYVYYTDANVSVSGAKSKLYDSTDGQLRCATTEYFAQSVIGYR